MEFNIYPVALNLQPYIKGYLVADSSMSKETGVHKLFPNGYSGIFFNFGILGKISIKEDYQTPKVSIFGQIDQCFDAIHLPGSYSLGVLFEPTMLSRFLRVNMFSLTNKVFDGQSIKPILQTLHEQMEACSLLTNKLKLLNHYFTKALIPAGYVHTLTDHAIRKINGDAFLNIKNLAASLGVSERFLEIRFKNEVGLSPKAYSMIVRFKRIEKYLSNQPNINWQNMDFACEFYDQNHFIKNFKRFTGHTPSDYLLNKLDMGRSYLIT